VIRVLIAWCLVSVPVSLFAGGVFRLAAAPTPFSRAPEPADGVDGTAGQSSAVAASGGSTQKTTRSEGNSDRAEGGTLLPQNGR